MSDFIAEIPSTWVVAPIEGLLAPLDDGRLLHHGWSPQCHAEPARIDDEWGVLKTTSIQAGAFQDEHNKRLPSDLTPRTLLEVRTGDILLTCAGPRARCGVACLVRDTRPRLILSGKMYRFRTPIGLLDPRYLEAYLMTDVAQAAIDGMKTGISDSGLNLTHDRFKKLSVVVAPSAEQHRISDALDSYFTRIDAAVTSLERVQRNLKRYRASVLKAAVEGRLVPTEAELARAEGRDYEPASVLLGRILLERRRRWEEAELAKMKAKGKVPRDEGWKAKYEEPVRADKSELSDLPAGWCRATLPQLGELNRGKSKHRPRNDPRLLGGPYPFIQTADVRHADGFITEHSATYSEFGLAQSRLWPAGTLCITIAANIAETGILKVDACFPDSIVGFQSGADFTRLRFIELFLRTAKQDLEQYASATAQKNINLEVLSAVAVPLPPYAEQLRIVNEVDRLLSVAASVDDSVRQDLQRGNRLRQSILKWAFEGRLVDQDPTDEPASKLLERINAARALESVPSPVPHARRKTSKGKAR